MKDTLELIKERKSIRGLFDSKKSMGKEDLHKILEACSWAPTAHNMQNFEIVVVDDKTLLQSIGNIKYTISKTYIKENYPHLSFSEEEFRKRKTGLLSTRFTATPKDDQKEITNDFIGKFLKATDVLLVFLYDPNRRAPASEGDFLGIMSLGCIMENMWLMANSLGIGVQIVSALIGGPVEKEVKRILNIPDHLRIAFSCRLGYPVVGEPKLARVRRDVVDFTHINKY
ncbi:nitroreductase family protein [Clostridium sp. PL3]|uniref:Nitroreductase family protein n=1 Tax=Clostridium thailandense TaxID=2794346 RepID=A0A949TY37_9CLOT|nr:nitroreductase family protein [Clostridium thailandense]MBV7274718.1 nitroreductase family protein [Clostridium thailandense]